MRVGVLALQGGYEPHAKKLRQLGADILLVRKESELDAIDGIVIPGGESTTLLRLCSPEFRNAIANKIKTDMPALVTCAGLIFISKKVENPSQECLGVLDIDLKRNAYGRQVDSFITKEISTTSKGSEILLDGDPKKTLDLEGVFIRAPKITRVGSGVEVLLEYMNEPILVKQKNIIGATFHPELGHGSTIIHQLFLKQIK